MTRVPVEPALLIWARERAGHNVTDLHKKFPKLDAWERGEVQPTMKQLEKFAQATHAPIGYLFLKQPPQEQIPIPDLRTVENQTLVTPSPNLLDTIYLCQRRQDWYHDFARSSGEEPLAFVGSAQTDSPIEETAQAMREALGFHVDERQNCPTWTDALRLFIDQAEILGVLVMVSSIVGGNPHRKLNPQEFRGFVLADPLAPLVFVNAADTKAAQMFTLAHELAHLWLGESALSDVDLASAPARPIEHWCNRVAAELLVPGMHLSNALPAGNPVEAVPDLARRYKVSTLVILQRLRDRGHISPADFEQAYARELAQLRARPGGHGGNFYHTLIKRVSRRFAQALMASTLEGHTLYRDAFHMLGIQKEKTFLQISRDLEYPPGPRIHPAM